MSVAPAIFVDAMRAHWTTTLANVSSPELEAVWSQMAHTFNRQIAAYGTPEGDRWKVLQPATGTGKSQGLVVYCSTLPAQDHPGVLIVTRLKTQADAIAEDINTLAGHEVALAYHGDNRVPSGELSKFPVLVITHAAYEIGMDAVNAAELARPKGEDFGFEVEEEGFQCPAEKVLKTTAAGWERYHTWKDERRKLTVVDEALDIIEEAQIDLRQVQFVKAIIPFDVAEKHPNQMAAIAGVEDVLKVMARRQASLTRLPSEHLLTTGVTLPDETSMTPLRRALKEMRLDRELLRRNDAEQNKKLIARYDTILRDIQATLENWNWYANKLRDHTINTARLIVPDDISGAVVLDATASSNLIYRLFGDRVEIIPTPSNARSYANVTLHVSMGHAVGKTTLVRNAKEATEKLIENLQGNLGRDRSVFVCCHQWVEPHLVSYDTGFSRFDVGHWGAVDGRNDWKEFDTAVIFGLPYRDRTWSANTFMALCGPQTTEWLNSEGNRPFQQYQDIRHSLEVGQLIVSIVQAMNRVRCRRVIDGQGNCPATDIYLLLPGDRTGKEVLEGIQAEMPGIKVEAWTYTEAKRRPRKSNHEEALARYARVMMSGRKSASDIRSELGIPQKTWEDLTVKLKDTNSTLAKRLVAEGVVYKVDQGGKVRRGWLAKD
jgi:hypothetical protein